MGYVSPIGLFNYARQGSLHTMIWTSAAIPIQIGVKSAFSESFYSLLSIGLTDTSRASVDALIGVCAMGAHIPIEGSLYLEADVGVQWSPVSAASLSSWGQLQGRVILGVEVADELSVFAGAARGVSLGVDPDTSRPTDTIFLGCELF